MELAGNKTVNYNGKLAIFTSFYSHMAFAPYVRCLATTLGVLSELGIKHEYLMRASDFHIERATNNTLTEIMERGDVTDVMLIDSDQSWEAEGVVRLLMHPEEIVGGSYRMKNQWHEYTGQIKYADGFPVGRTLADGTPLLSAERVAAGFMRIKVSALRKFHDAYPDLRSEEPDGIKTQFFTRILRDGVMHCQDMAFSRLCLEAGIALWIDPMVKVGHWGMTCYEGDLGAHLKRQHGPQNAAFDAIRDMAAEIEQRKAA
jgi:hypothetical protein